jgi:aminoglycoside/choline kinase family phosphotransferase
MGKLQSKIEPNDQRAVLAKKWLEELGYSYCLHSPIADASFRRYWHLHNPKNAQITPPYLLMDCPPEKEDLSIFIKTQHILKKNPCWKVPTIIAEDMKQGFALIENFGEYLFSTAYQENSTYQPQDYIELALKALVGLQEKGAHTELPHYDDKQLQQEMDLFIPWFVEAFCDYSLTPSEQSTIAECEKQLIDNMLNQPQVIVHRDYHCRNLMLVPATENALTISTYSLGVLDFQDALNGAITYDAVSLIKDCYWKLSPQEQTRLLHDYWKNLQGKINQLPDWERFQKDFHFSGIQRHFKVLGIFSRLALSYNKPHYLDHLPLTLDHFISALEKYLEFSALSNLAKKLAEQAEIRRIKLADESNK